MRNAKADIKDKILKMFTQSEGLVSVVVVLLGFVVATILVLIVGRNPAGMYSGIFQTVTGFDLRRWVPVGSISLPVWNPRYIGEWFVYSMPLILCGFSMGFAAKTGLFNIGAEGQYVVGLTAAQFAAFYFPRIPVLHWVLAVVFALAVSGIWGGVVGYFKARFSVSEVVSTIMMNYIALFGSRILTSMIPGTNTDRTPPYPPTATLAIPSLQEITNHSRLNWGILLTLAAIFFYWIVMGRTRLGYSLRATGFNKEAARYGGINVNGSVTTSMAIAGAFAGLAGAIVALGSFSYGRVLSSQDNYGFDGIAVALVGNSTAWGTALAGLLFGMLKSAQPLMQSRRIPDDITTIISGVIVVFISLRAGVRLIVEWQMKEKLRKSAESGQSAAGSGQNV